MIEVAAEVKYWIVENNRGVFSLGQSRKVELRSGQVLQDYGISLKRGDKLFYLFIYLTALWHVSS